MLFIIYKNFDFYSPDTATYIQKIEREREAREKGKSNNNKSMLGKYVS